MPGFLPEKGGCLLLNPTPAFFGLHMLFLFPLSCGTETKPKQVVMARREYVSLFEKMAAAGNSASSKKRPSMLTAQEQRRLDELEEELPLQAILMFRTMARKKVCWR